MDETICQYPGCKRYVKGLDLCIECMDPLYMCDRHIYRCGNIDSSEK